MIRSPDAALAEAEVPGVVATVPGQAVALPSVWWLGLGRGGVELKSFFRDKMAVAFIFGLPSILLVLLGSIFGGQAAARGVTVGQLFTAGMIAGGIMATTFQYLAIGIATEREDGMLKRLSGTPMPPAAYFMGKVIQVMVCTVAETVLLMAVGIGLLSPAPTRLARPVVDLRLGVPPRHRGLLPDGYRGQQPAEIGGERRTGDHAALHGAAIHLRGVRAVQ